MSEEDIIKTIDDYLYEHEFYLNFIDGEKEKKQYLAIQGLLDLYQRLKSNKENIEREYTKRVEEKIKLKEQLQQEKEKSKLLILGKFREVADKNSYIKDMYISKDKIAKILGLDSTVTTETILQYIEILESENARLEDIEDKKVQIEYELVFNKGVNSMKDKISAKIKELEGQEDWYIENKSLDDLYGRIDELKELLERRNK